LEKISFVVNDQFATIRFEDIGQSCNEALKRIQTTHLKKLSKGLIPCVNEYVAGICKQKVYKKDMTIPDGFKDGDIKIVRLYCLAQCYLYHAQNDIQFDKDFAKAAKTVNSLVRNGQTDDMLEYLKTKDTFIMELKQGVNTYKFVFAPHKGTIQGVLTFFFCDNIRELSLYVKGMDKVGATD